uniref:EGF-like domain-containing protein n=1 Tax=Neogobius melanostomus TaxID=47308 RepID=A0A8C6V290_9GOBI
IWTEDMRRGHVGNLFSCLFPNFNVWESFPFVSAINKNTDLKDRDSFDNYCFNNGQCMFLVDLNENTCKCELGFRGSRCEQLLLVSKPMGETQKAFIIVCVILLIIAVLGGSTRPVQRHSQWSESWIFQGASSQQDMPRTPLQ